MATKKRKKVDYQLVREFLDMFVTKDSDQKDFWKVLEVKGEYEYQLRKLADDTETRHTSMDVLSLQQEITKTMIMMLYQHPRVLSKNPELLKEDPLLLREHPMILKVYPEILGKDPELKDIVEKERRWWIKEGSHLEEGGT